MNTETKVNRYKYNWTSGVPERETEEFHPCHWDLVSVGAIDKDKTINLKKYHWMKIRSHLQQCMYHVSLYEYQRVICEVF